eukprot:5611206-Amphidinium_carterae.1
MEVMVQQSSSHICAELRPLPASGPAKYVCSPERWHGRCLGSMPKHESSVLANSCDHRAFIASGTLQRFQNVLSCRFARSVLPAGGCMKALIEDADEDEIVWQPVSPLFKPRHPIC